MAGEGRRRNRFKVHPEPTAPMSKGDFVPSRLTACPDDLAAYEAWFDAHDDARRRFGWVMRDSLDEVLDGPRTGRWAYQHLAKTERTHLGTVVEVNLTKEFEIADGDDLDWSIAGADLDCKFSRELGGWEMPMEMYRCDDHGERSGKADQAALLVWMDDDGGRWAAGLLRITDERLRWRANGTRGYNRDNKRRLTAEAMSEIWWLWGGLQTDLPDNILLHMDPAVRAQVLKPSSSGQTRVTTLFREVQGRVIDRGTVLTVGQQDDAPKRVRDARRFLRERGIIILGHQQSHPHIARALQLPIPVKGEWLAARLVPVAAEAGRRTIILDSRAWAVARPYEPEVPLSRLL